MNREAERKAFIEGVNWLYNHPSVPMIEDYRKERDRIAAIRYGSPTSEANPVNTRKKWFTLQRETANYRVYICDEVDRDGKREIAYLPKSALSVEPYASLELITGTAHSCNCEYCTRTDRLS